LNLKLHHFISTVQCTYNVLYSVRASSVKVWETDDKSADYEWAWDVDWDRRGHSYHTVKIIVEIFPDILENLREIGSTIIIEEPHPHSMRKCADF